MQAAIVFIIVLLVLMIIGNILYRRSIQNLSVEKQADLREIQHGFQVTNIIVLCLFLGGYIVAWRMKWFAYSFLAILFISLVLLYYTGMVIVSYRKLKKQDFGKGFLRNYLICQLIRILALLSVLVLFYGMSCI